MVNDLSAGSVRLFNQPAPAVLTTYRKDGSAATSPAWFRYRRGNLEVVLADGDTKLGQLARDPRCSLTIFEAHPPFRGVRIEGAPRLEIDEGNKARLEIASRYLGPDRGRRFVEQRTTLGRILHIEPSSISEWDLTTILPPP